MNVAKLEKTGMIANNLHKPGTELTDKQSALFSPLDETPIWAEARKQGKITATVLFLGSNPEEGHEATYAIYCGTTWSESVFVYPSFKKAVDWKQLPESYSPVKEVSLSLKLEKKPDQKMYILATDSTDNGVTDYDTFYFYTEKNGPVLETVHPDEWGSLSFPIDSDYLAGFSFKLKEVDASLNNIKFYRTAITSQLYMDPKNLKIRLQKNMVIYPFRMTIRHLKING